MKADACTHIKFLAVLGVCTWTGNCNSTHLNKGILLFRQKNSVTTYPVNYHVLSCEQRQEEYVECCSLIIWTLRNQRTQSICFVIKKKYLLQKSRRCWKCVISIKSLLWLKVGFMVSRAQWKPLVPVNFQCANNFSKLAYSKPFNSLYINMGRHYDFFIH